ncbi:unnamed protein product, partial [Timema podura]|nr:unnamed protein product [Timema podura]
QHWIHLELFPDVLVHSLRMTVDPADSSYMPSLVVVNAGDTFTTMRELSTVNIRTTDTVVTLLADIKEYYACVEVAVKQCRNGGIDCKIHSLGIVGRRKTNEGHAPSSLSFLASDNDDMQ